MDSWLVQYTSYLASVNIPERLLRSLEIAAAMINMMISRENNIRRLPRMSLDRLYIAHTRRIIVTVVNIRVTFSESAQQPTIGRAKKEKEYPCTDYVDYRTLKAPTMEHEYIRKL